MRRKQFLIVGVGRFGAAMAVTLSNLDHEVVAIDNDEAVLNDVVDKVTHAAIVDATNESALAKLDVPSFDSVIIAIGQNLEASILATIATKSAGARHLVSKADTELTARVLASVGADEVVRPEHDMGVRLARQLATPGIVHALDLGPEHRVVEVETSGVRGTLAELNLPRRFGVQVIAVRPRRPAPRQPGRRVHRPDRRPLGRHRRERRLPRVPRACRRELVTTAKPHVEDAHA